jgi:hypothetical protein
VAEELVEQVFGGVGQWKTGKAERHCFTGHIEIEALRFLSLLLRDTQTPGRTKQRLQRSNWQLGCSGNNGGLVIARDAAHATDNSRSVSRVAIPSMVGME